MGLLESLKQLHQTNPSVGLYNAAQAGNSVDPNIGMSNPNYNVQPGQIETISGLASDNITNSFLNSIAKIAASSTKDKIREIDHSLRLKDKEIYDLEDKIQEAQNNNDTYSAEFYSSKLRDKLKERADYEQATAEDRKRLEAEVQTGSGLTGIIAGGEKDIARRHVSLDYQALANYFKLEPNTDLGNALKYELPEDLGGSFSTMGMTAATMVTPALIRMALPRLAVAAGAGSVAPGVGTTVAAVTTLGALAVDLYLQNRARQLETGAESDEAYNQASEAMLKDYMIANNITDPSQLEDPVHKRAINNIQIKAYEGLEGLRVKNNALAFGDALQSVLAITPYTKFADRLLSSNKWLRAGARIGAGVVTMGEEMNEEGSQWLFQQQYLNKVLGLNNPSFKDETNYKDNSFSGLLSQAGQLINDRFRVEKSIFYNDDRNLYMSDEFRSAANSGAFAAGPLSTMPAVIGTARDFIQYQQAKSRLGRAAKEQQNGEWLRFKYDTYFKFLESDRADYFINNIRALGKIDGSGVTAEQAEREVARFKRAHKEFKKLDDPTYLGGFIELADMRRITKDDRKRAIKNSLMMTELSEQIAEIEALRLDQAKYQAHIDSFGDPTQIDYLAKRKALFELLSSKDKIKDFKLSDLYGDFDLPILLKDMQMEKLRKENERISTGEFSAERRQVAETIRKGTDAQRNAIAFKYGSEYLNHPMMTGLDGKNVGEKEYTEFLEDLEQTSQLRELDKRLAIHKMLDEDAPIMDIVNTALAVNAPLDQATVDSINERIHKNQLALLDKASQIKDGYGETKQFLFWQELQQAFDDAEVEDPDYARELKVILDHLESDGNITDIFSGTNLVREPEYTSTSSQEKEVSFVKDRFLDEMASELAKALGDEEYLDSNTLNKLAAKLKWLRDVLNDEKHLNTTTRRDLVNLRNVMDKLEADFTEAEKNIRQRLANKDLEQEKAYNTSTQDVLTGIGITYSPTQDKDKLVSVWNALPGEIVSVIKAFVDSVAVQDKNGNWYLHHSYAEAIKEYVLASDPKVLEDLNTLYNSSLNDLYLYFKGLWSTTFPTSPAFEKLYHPSILEADLDTFLNQMFRAFKRSNVQDLSNPLSEFITTRDIQYLLKATKEDVFNNDFDKTTNEDEQYAAFKALVDKFRLIRSLSVTISNYNKDMTIKGQLQNEINIFNTLTEYLPTKQQLVALRQIVSWFSSKAKYTPNMVLFGYAGSGKTQVVTKLLLRLLGITSKDIFAFTPTKSSNRNLHNALGITDPNLEDPIKSFLEADVASFANKKLVILDEVGLVSPTQLAAINGKMAEIREAHGTKIIMLGDPTQLSKLKIPAITNFLEADVASFAGKKLVILDEVGLVSPTQLAAINGKMAEIREAHGTKIIMLGDPTQLSKLKIPAITSVLPNNNVDKQFAPPLTITYRTDDIDIIRTQKAFRNKTTKVSQVPTGVTKDQQFGSIGLNIKNDIYNLIVKNNTNGRNKIVIVNDEAAVKVVTEELVKLGVTNANVMTIFDAQSHTVDEVYVMLTPSGELSPDNDDYFVYNKAMYVATSRARYLSAVFSPDIQFSNDTKTLLKEETKQQLDPKTKADFIAELQTQLDAITNSELNKGLAATPAPVNIVQNPAVQTPANTNTAASNPTQATTDTEESIPEFDGMSDVDQSGEQVEDNQATINEVAKEEAIADQDNNESVTSEDHVVRYPQYKTIKSNDERFAKNAHVMYVPYWDSKANQRGVALVAQAKNGKYYLIGVIGKTEIEEQDKFKLPEVVKQHLSNPDFQKPDPDDITFDKAFDNDGALRVDINDHTLPIAEGTLKKASPKYLSWSNISQSLRSYLDNFHDMIFTKYAQASQNMGVPDLSKLNNWSIKIYNSKEISDPVNKINPRIVRPGIPYFVYTLPHRNGGQERFYIPLNTRKLNANKDKDTIQIMQSFILTLQEVETMLSHLDGDVKIRFGGMELMENFHFTNREGKQFKNTQGEVFKDLLSPHTANAQRVMQELSAKGVDIALLRAKLDEIRNGLFTPIDLSSYGYDPVGSVKNADGKDDSYMDDYFITGVKGSRRLVPGSTKVGNHSYTEHPKLPGFYLIEKGTGDHAVKVWRKVYNYKGLHIKIDIPITDKGTERPKFEVHSQLAMDNMFNGQRVPKSVNKDGTIVSTGTVYNTAIGPEEYVNSTIDERLLHDKHNQGPVQQIFDSFARANSHIKYGKDKVWLRRSRKTETGDRTFFTGLDLLYTYNIEADPEASKLPVSYTHKYRPTKDSTEQKTESVTPAPITTETLDAMFGASTFDQNGDSTLNEGFGLRMPIHSSTVAKHASETNEEYESRIFTQVSHELETNFAGVTPTEIVVSEVQKYEKARPVESTVKSNTTPSEKITDIKRIIQEELKNAGLAADLRSIISSRLIKEGVSQEDRNRLIGTQSSPIITSVTSEDISNLLISYQNNKNKQLEEFNKQGEGFNPSTGNFVNNDTSFWDNKISKLEQINAELKEVQEGSEIVESNPLDDFNNSDLTIPMDDEGEDFTFFGESPKRWVSKEFILKIAKQIFGEKWASNPDNIIFLTKEEMVARLGKDVWGHFNKGIIYLQTDHFGRASVDVFAHESFHRVMRMFFKPEERSHIYELAVRINPELIKEDIRNREEWLANEYMKWNRNANSVSRLLWNAFMKIKKFLRFHYTNQERLKIFFDRIDKGNYTTERTDVNVESIGLDALKILEWFGTLEDKSDASANYNAAQIGILKSLSQKLFPKVFANDTENGVVVKMIGSDGSYKNIAINPSEAKVLVYNDLKAQYIQLGENSPVWLKILMSDKGNIFNNMFSYLVRGDKLDWKAFAEEVNEKDPSLKDDIEESIRINYENQLLANVKNLFAAVFLYIKEGDKYLQGEHIPGRQVFYRSLMLLKGIESFDSSAIAQIQFNLQEHSGDPRMERVAQLLIDVIERTTMNKFVVSKKDGKTVRKFVPAGWDVANDGIRVNGKILTITNSDGKVLGEATRTRKAADGSIKVDSTTNDYIRRMTKALKFSGMKVKDDYGNIIDFAELDEQAIANMLATLLARNEARDLQAGIKAGILSLVERNPYVAIIDVERDAPDPVTGETYAGVSYRYIPNTLLGGEESIKLDLQSSLLELATTPEHQGKLREAAARLEKASNDTSIEAKSEALSYIFGPAVLNTKYQTINLSILQTIRIIEALKPIVNSLVTSIAKGESAESIEEVLKAEQSNRFGIIKSALGLSEGFGENSSFLDANNRKVYKFVKGAFISKVWESLNMIFNKNGGKVFKVPDFLQPDTISYKNFFRFNIFTREKNRVKILGKVDHDALRIRDEEQTEISATPYKNEKVNGWVLRNIVFGFITQMRQYSGQRLSYYQFPYTPSNKPTNYGYKIKASNEKEITSHIKEAILQQLARYEWYTELAKKGVFVKGIDIKPIMKDGKLTYVWGKKLHGGFSSLVDDNIDLNNLEESINNITKNINRYVDASFAQYSNEALDLFKFVRESNAMRVVIKGIGREAIQDSEYEVIANKLRTTEGGLGLVSTNTYNNLKAILKNYLGDNYTKEDLNKFVVLYAGYVQNYVNGHFINQLGQSDRSLYKGATDQVKRASGAISPHDRPQLNETINIIVAEDDSKVFNRISDVVKAYEGIHGITVKSTDAQMFYLPKWRKKLEEGYSRAYKVKDVLKPMLYFIDKYGIVRFSKNSGIELTDAMCNRFPELRDLRQEMENNNVMEYHMASAFKVGMPARIVKKDETITQHMQATSSESRGNGLVEVPTKYYGIQLNPTSSEGDITNFSQLTYFLNVNKLNDEATDLVYKVDAELMSGNFDKWLRKLGKFVGNEFEKNETEVRKMLANIIGATPGNERYEELIMAKDKDGWLVDLNFPAIRGRVEISLMSTAAKNSVKSITGTGSKLVLQSSTRTSIYRLGGSSLLYNDLSTEQKVQADKFYSIPRSFREALMVRSNHFHLTGSEEYWNTNKHNLIEYASLTKDEQQYIDEFNMNQILVPTKLNMVTDPNSPTGRVAEVIAPAWWKTYKAMKGQAVTEGDIIVDDFLTRFAFGVRIPSTGIHSAIPFKIVGFTTASSNIIIAPEELVALHGSDFDVDSLFAIRVEILNEPKSDKTLATLTDLDGNVLVHPGQRLGWPHDTKLASFEEMMMVQGATEESIKTNEFDKQLSSLKALRDKLVPLVELNSANLSELPEEIRAQASEELKELKLKLALTEQAIQKTLQNKRNFAIQWILLRENNRYDMMQPISFDAIKEDFFDPGFELDLPTKSIKIYKKGKLTEEFKSLLTEENRSLYKIVDKFLSWGITAENSDVIKFNEDKNKFTITDASVRNNIYNDPELSVKTKLKLVFNMIDLEGSRDLNNQLHNLQYYADNFAGVALTGAFANFVKSLAYIYYAAPKDSFFITKNKSPLAVKIDGVTYSTIATTERGTKRKIWELLDTLINGAIDNVKEQVLAMLNATNSTGPILATFVGMGVNLKTTVSLLRQPVIILSNLSGRDNKLVSLKRELVKTLMTELSINEKELNEKINSVELTTAALDRVLTKFGYDEIAPDLSKLDHEDMITQIRVIDMYRKVEEVSGALSLAAGVTNILRDFPVTDTDIKETKSNIAALQEYNGISSGSIFDIPHIKAAKEIFNKALAVRSSVLPSRNPNLVNKLSLFLNTVTAFLDRENAVIDSEVVLQEFEKYLLSSITTISPLDTEWKKTVKLINDGKTIYLVGNDAWIYNFGKTIKDLRLKYPSNEFLKYLVPTPGSAGTYRKSNGKALIHWTVGNVTNEPSRTASLQVDFLKLPEEIQDAIMKFSALEQGAEFGIRSYSSLLSPRVLSLASKIFSEAMNNVLDENKFSNFKEHFILPFLLRNPNYVSDWQSNKLWKNHGRIIYKNNPEYNAFLGNRNANNIAFVVDFNTKVNKTGEAYKQTLPPKFFRISSNKNALYMRVEVEDSAKLAYYIKVGNINKQYQYKAYNFEPKYINEQFSLVEALNKEHPTISVNPEELGNDSITTDLFDVNDKFLPKVGDLKLLKPAQDLYNNNTVLYEVAEVIPEGKEKFETDNSNKSNTVVKEDLYYYKSVKIKFNKKEPVAKEQRNSSSNTLGIRAIKVLLERLSKTLKLNYEIVDFNSFGLLTELGLNKNIAGFYHNGKVYINSNKLNAETPIHEFGHGLLLIIKAQNKVLYNNLVRQIKDSSILEEIKQSYPDLSIEDQIDEAIVTAIGRYGLGMTQSWSKQLISAIQRIFDSILRFFGLLKPTDVRSLSPDTSILNLAAMLLNGREIAFLESDLTGVSELRYLNEQQNITREIGEERPDGYLVATSLGSKLLTRVSSLLDSLSPYGPSVSREETSAKRYFREHNVKEDQLAPHPTIEGQSISFADTVDYFKKSHERSRLAGKIIHKILQIAFLGNNNPEIGKHRELLNGLYDEYEKLGGTRLNFDWLTGNTTYINGLKEKLNIDETDEILPEFLVYNEQLNLGGTIDLLIKHKDGSFSIIDFKTGNLESRYKRVDFMKFGDKVKFAYDIKGRYQLQLATYAMLLKSKYPNARFRNIRIETINPQLTNQKSLEIDRTSTLSLLENYFKHQNNTYAKENSFLFKHEEYNALSKSVSDKLSEALKAGAKDVYAARTKVLNKLYDELDKLRRTGGPEGKPLTEKYIQQSPVIRNLLGSITTQIAELNALDFGNVTEPIEDMETLEKLTSVGFNVKNRFLKVFMKLRMEALKLIYETRYELRSESDRLLKAVKDEYYSSRPVQNVTRKLGINMLSYSDIFDFMWNESEEKGLTIVTEQDAKFATLSPAQKKYNVFYRESIRDLMFSTLSTSRGIAYYNNKLSQVNNDPLIAFGLYTKEELVDKYTKKIKEFTEMKQVDKWVDELGKTFEYTEDFTPRLPKLNGEIELTKDGEFLKNGKKMVENIHNWALYKVTSYVNYDNNQGYKRIGVPLKYINSYNQFDTNQTKHTELIMMMFAKNMINKRFYDDLSAFGLSVADMFEGSTNKLPASPAAAEFLRTYINNNLHEVKSEEDSTVMNKTIHKKLGGRDISLERITRTLMSLGTAAKLSFGTLGAASNLVLNIMLTYKEAIKGSIAKQILDVEPDDLSFTITDLVKAHKIYFEAVGDWLMGKPNKFNEFDAIYNVSQQQFLSTSSKQGLSVAKNKAFDDRWLYLTYGIGDKFANSIIFLAILNHKQTKSKDGSLTSIWDNYTLSNGKLTWIGGTRGRKEDGSLVTELTGQEIMRLKKITGRIVGEYDPELRRMMESNAFLAMFLQFHKYLPNKFEYAYQGAASGEFANASLGKYIEVLDHESGKKLVDTEGNPILRWESVIDRGMTLVTYNTIKNDVFSRTIKLIKRALYVSKAVENDLNNDVSYFSTLSKEQQQHVIMQLLNLMTMIVMVSSTIIMFGDDDDDDKDPIKRRIIDLRRDLTIEFNPYEMLKFLNKPTVVLPSLLETVEGINTMFAKGFEENKKGEIMGSRQASSLVPFSAAYNQLIRNPWYERSKEE